MRSPSAALLGLSSALVVAGLLVGCAGSDEGAATIDSVVATVATVAADTTDTAVADPVVADATMPETTDASPITDAPPVTDAPADDGACLVGDWVVTDDEMDAYYAAVTSMMDAPITLDTTGSAPLSFAADGTYAWAPAFALTVEVAGASGTGDVTGTITGDWTAVDGVVTTASDVNALVVSIAVNGVVVDGGDLANGFLNSSPVNGVTYSCDGPTPVLDFQTGDPSVTVPVTLTPA